MARPTSQLNFNQSRYPFRFFVVKNALTCRFLSLEKALHDALKSILEKGGGSDPRTRFYNKFKEEVDEHDDDLQEEHGEDLNTVLIFVSFSTPAGSTQLMDLEVRSVFCRDFRIHNRYPVRAQAELRRNE